MADRREPIEILSSDAELDDASVVSETSVAGRRISRRDLLAATIGAALAGTVAWVTSGYLRPGGRPGNRITNLADATTELDAGRVDDILAVVGNGVPWYPPDRDGQRLAVVGFDAADDAVVGTYLESVDYAVDAGVVLIALALRDPDLGCRVVLCNSSQWWENPCHGQRHNLIGEWQSGKPSPGLDRHPTRIEDGHLIVGLWYTIAGPPPSANVDDRPPAGPPCIGSD